MKKRWRSCVRWLKTAIPAPNPFSRACITAAARCGRISSRRRNGFVWPRIKAMPSQVNRRHVLDGQGVPQDNAESAKWYRLAADQGNPQAQYNLCLWYAQGEGGTPDNVQAYMWFNLAAARFPPGDTRGRSLAASSREAIATDMTSAQIARAAATEARPE
jgi:hypothetical protein